MFRLTEYRIEHLGAMVVQTVPLVVPAGAGVVETYN